MRKGSKYAPRWLPRLRRSFTPAPSDVGIDSMTCCKLRVLMSFSIASESGRERGDLGGRLGEARLPALRAHRQALGINELDFLHAEKRQKVADVARLRVERRACIKSAAG